jgi:hypothetical protein
VQHAEALGHGGAPAAVAVEQLEHARRLAQAPRTFDRLRHIDRVDEPHTAVGDQGV